MASWKYVFIHHCIIEVNGSKVARHGDFISSGASWSTEGAPE